MNVHFVNLKQKPFVSTRFFSLAIIFHWCFMNYSFTFNPPIFIVYDTWATETNLSTIYIMQIQVLQDLAQLTTAEVFPPIWTVSCYITAAPGSVISTTSLLGCWLLPGGPPLFNWASPQRSSGGRDRHLVQEFESMIWQWHMHDHRRKSSVS